MLLRLAQPALAEKHHAQVVVSKFEILVQMHRALESLLGPAQIVCHEVGHAQVVV